MKSRILVVFLLLSISLFNFISASAQDGNSASMLQPPETEKKPKITEINGDRMVDNYFWLREKTNPAVIAHLEAENAYTGAMMKPTEALQEKLAAADIAFGRVNGPGELAHHPHLRRIEVGSPNGPLSYPAPPAQRQGEQRHYRPVPAVGEHSEKIRAEFRR